MIIILTKLKIKTITIIIIIKVMITIIIIIVNCTVLRSSTSESIIMCFITILYIFIKILSQKIKFTENYCNKDLLILTLRQIHLQFN